MSAEVTLTGTVGNDPELAYTQNAKARLRLSLAATPRRLNRDTNMWEDDGDPLWITATLWEKDAERLAEVLVKGDRVSVRGTLRHGSYEVNGETKHALELTGARFLGLIPRASHASQDRFSGPQSGGVGNHASAAYNASQSRTGDVAGNLAQMDQWAGRGNSEAPF